MSIGYHGFAKLFSEDDTFVYYAYSGANFNDKTRDKEADYYYDGRFRINKDILNRIKMLPEKDYPYYSWTDTAIDEGYLIIDRECQNAFHNALGREYPIDYILLRLLYHVFEEIYKLKDEIKEFPEKVVFLQ